MRTRDKSPSFSSNGGLFILSKYLDKYMESYSKMVANIMENASITRNLTKEEVILIMNYKKELAKFERKPAIIQFVNELTTVGNKLSGLLNISKE